MAEPARQLPAPALMARALPEGCLAPLFEGLAEPLTYKRLTQHFYHDTRATLERVALGPALQALREAGILSPCSNAGDRGIVEVDVWNRWLADPAAGPEAAAQVARHAPLAKWARTEALGVILPALREAGLAAPRGRDEDLDLPAGFAARLPPFLEPWTTIPRAAG
jgi:hypothetical protein